MAPETGFCLGCLRSGEEIAAWRGAGDSERREILDRVTSRRAAGFKVVKPKNKKTTAIG